MTEDRQPPGGRRAKSLVVVGQIVGGLLPFLLTPLLTRIFDPAALGTYQLALAVALVLQPLSTLRVEFALPVTRTRRTTRRLIMRAGWSTAAVCSALSIVSLVSHLTGNHDVAPVALMAVMLNLTYSWGAVDTSLLIRAQDLRALALRNVLFGILTAMLQLLFALLVPAAILLAVAVTLGRVAAVTLTRSAGASDDLPGVRTETQYGWRRSLLAVTSALSGSAAAQGLPLFLGASQGLQQVGYAAVAQRLSTVPATQLAQAFTQLIQIEASRSINKGEERLASALRRPLAVTATFAALAGLGVGAVGPFVVTPLLGPGWEAVAELLPALGILTAAQLLAGAFSPVLAMLGREAWLVGINVGRLLLSIGGATVVSWSTGDLTSVVAGYVVGATIAYVIHMLVVLLGIRRFDSSRPAD